MRDLSLTHKQRRALRKLVLMVGGQLLLAGVIGPIAQAKFTAWLASPSPTTINNITINDHGGACAVTDQGLNDAPKPAPARPTGVR